MPLGYCDLILWQFLWSPRWGRSQKNFNVSWEETYMRYALREKYKDQPTFEGTGFIQLVSFLNAFHFYPPKLRQTFPSFVYKLSKQKQKQRNRIYITLQLKLNLSGWSRMCWEKLILLHTVKLIISERVPQTPVECTHVCKFESYMKGKTSIKFKLQ